MIDHDGMISFTQTHTTVAYTKQQKKETTRVARATSALLLGCVLISTSLLKQITCKHMTSSAYWPTSSGSL